MLKSGSSNCFVRGNGAARILSAPLPPSPVPSTAIPPPPEKMGSRQHHDMFSFGGSRLGWSPPRPLLRLPPSSESDESSSFALSFIRLGDRVAPGAHQKRLYSALSSPFRSSSEENDPDACPIVPPSVELFPNARFAKCRVFARFRGIGLLNAQLAQSVLRQPMQCMRTLHDSQRSRIISLHWEHLTSSTKMLWLFLRCAGTCLPSPWKWPFSVPSGSPSCPVSEISHSLPSWSPRGDVPSNGPMRLLERQSLSNGTHTSMFCGPALPAW